ncbi:MAG: tellurite resistance TerB family protein [Gammaproteobacteria bacterium]|nr:MAG: tellurite resistance TerB family protein [Gammaproteobacteria bacterium]
MNIQNLLNQFMGAVNTAPDMNTTAPGFTGRLSKLTGSLPGGLVGGAAAGGIMALLMSNKSARKFASTAATYGGAAILGGLAFKAFKAWRHNNSHPTVEQHEGTNRFITDMDLATATKPADDFEVKLIKAMIAAAKADGHIDETEQQHIFNAINQMELSLEMKALVFDLLSQPITVNDIVHSVTDITQKSEIYLVSCLVINPDHPSEQIHLSQLAETLQLPDGLREQIHLQAQMAISEAH